VELEREAPDATGEEGGRGWRKMEMDVEEDAWVPLVIRGGEHLMLG
jgi:hypothetical protein